MKKTKKAKNPPLPNDHPERLAEPTCEEIAAIAYSIWEKEGRPEGRDVEHWLAAEIQLGQARSRRSFLTSPVRAGQPGMVRATTKPVTHNTRL
jgi:hypothetical protein